MFSLLSQRRVREDFKKRRRKSPSSPFFKGGLRNHPFTVCTQTAISIVIAILLSLALPSLLFAQSKPLKEVRVPYALGGSTGFFWVAQRSGSFEKYGIKVLPIFMRGGREAVQALISRDVYDASARKFRRHPCLGAGRERSGRPRRHRQQTRLCLRQQPQHQEAGGSQRQESRHQPVGRQHRFHRPPSRAPAWTQ